MRDGLGAVQKVLLLGGSSEIGLAIVRELADQGRLTDVFLAGRSPAKLTVASDALALAYPALTVTTCAFDAEQPSDHEQMINEVFAQGPIDCVISAFGQLGNNDDLEGDIETIRRFLTVNYVAAVTSGTLVVNHLRKQGYGSFVVISSVAVERSRLDNYVYASTKAGLDSWACGLADSLVGTGVQVLVVRPGFVDTVMTHGIAPAPLATTPKAVAEVTVNGLRRGASLVWAPPMVRPLMSALRHLPRPVFRVVSKRASS